MQRDLLRIDGIELPVHPLDEQIAALRLADAVPPQDALHRRPASLVQRRDDLAVVERVRFCDCQLEHLASCERLWRSWVDRAFAVFLRVYGDERLVARRLGLREPVAAAEDAVDVLRADLARKLGGIVRPVGEEEELRAELELDHRLYLGVRVVVLRTADDEVRLHRRILGNDWRPLQPEPSAASRTDRTRTRPCPS